MSHARHHNGSYVNDNQYYNNGNGNGYGAASYGAGYSEKPYTSQGTPKKKRTWLWVILAIVAVVVILAAVLGGVFGSRAAHNNSTSSSDSGSGSGSGTASGAGSIASAKKGSGNGAVLPTVNAWGQPLYPTTTGSAQIAAPTLITNGSLSCGSDPYNFTDPASFAVRTEHPLLFAPAYKWECLPKLIAGDTYMSYWNATIMQNATKYYDMPPTNYSIDGGLTGSGVLDVARQVQLKIKHFGYAWKMTNDTKWVDRAWLELQTASGNSTTGQYFGITGNNWNTGHLLDLGEFMVAFGIGYDWMYEAWTADQRTAIMWSILELGVKYGLQVFEDPSGAAADFSWPASVDGNWNCVTNNGFIVGSLAIANEDPTGTALQLVKYATANIGEYCAFATSPDGTWTETANYWYFGTYAYAEAASALMTATGSTQNILDANEYTKLTGLFHMYITGMQGLFTYGDTGPNKYSTTANGMMIFASHFNIPMYSLFQRDRADAPEPMSMLWYDPQVSGDWWYDLALDNYFWNTTDSWVSMRSSWTDTDGTYTAMKCGELTGHQTHGDVDIGDFVLDAMGQRWAGEYGCGNYLAEGYFTSEDQNAERWWYYRKRIEGQNTIVLNNALQNVEAVPSTSFGSTNDTQTALVYTPTNTSTAYFTCNMTAAYNGTSAERAIRFINGRKQFLLQDEFDVPSTGTGAVWRMSTNATITTSNNNATATLTLGGQTMVMNILSPSGAVFSTAEPVRLSTDPTLASGSENQDQPNPGVTVLTIQIPAGQQTLQVLFNPQWPGWNSDSYVTPPTVAIADWSTTSHN